LTPYYRFWESFAFDTGADTTCNFILLEMSPVFEFPGLFADVVSDGLLIALGYRSWKFGGLEER
jgi:hypothetical protein